MDLLRFASLYRLAATQVRRERTPMTGPDAEQALSQAWSQVVGSRPSPETLSILLGQWAMETGHGKKMWNYNFGGIKGTSPEGLTTSYKTHEGYGDTRQAITDRFRAYSTAEEGAKDYVGLLARKYGDAIEAAKAGDPRDFVTALRAGGYFTGDPAAYTRAVSSISEKVLREGSGSVGQKPKPGEVASKSPSGQLDPQVAQLVRYLSRL